MEMAGAVAEGGRVPLGLSSGLAVPSLAHPLPLSHMFPGGVGCGGDPPNPLRPSGEHVAWHGSSARQDLSAHGVHSMGLVSTCV